MLHNQSRIFSRSLCQLFLRCFHPNKQDVEYLVTLSQTLKQPRWVIGNVARKELMLTDAKVEKLNEDDAGRAEFSSTTPEMLWKLRTQVGTMLNEAKPAPMRKLVDLRPANRQLQDIPYAGYVSVAPSRQGK